MFPSSAIKINNNISHTARLKLIEKADGKYRLTPLGKKFWRNEISNEEVMRLAMLKYSYKQGELVLFPYRAVLEILLAVDHINYIEFLFGIYPLQNTSSHSIDEAIRVINNIQKKYFNIYSASQTNKRRIVDALNESYDTNFTVAETWGSTTINNKFIYFRENLSLFNGISFENGNIVISEEAKPDIIDLLESSREN